MEQKGEYRVGESMGREMAAPGVEDRRIDLIQELLQSAWERFGGWWNFSCQVIP